MLGTGTQADPYIIENVNDLQNMNNDLSAYYELGGNIDASDTINWNSGAGFVPVSGGYNYPFTGSLDGKNYEITDLYINRPSSNYQGLFGFIMGATIKNISVNADITANNYSGILASRDRGNSSFYNCETSGSLTGVSTLGGFVYSIETGTVIDNCKNTANVTASGTNGEVSYIGGFIGYSYGDIQIKNCNNSCNVTVSCDYSTEILTYAYIGHFAGNLESNTLIAAQNCYTEGTFDLSSMTGYYTYIGGFAGGVDRIDSCGVYLPTSTISGVYAGGFAGIAESTNCYTIVFEVQESYLQAGGFVGRASGRTEYCYCVAEVTGTTYYHAFRGDKTTGATISDCYYDSDVCSIPGVYAAGLTTTQMKDSSNFTDWDFTSIWQQDTGNINGGYHILQSVNYPSVVGYTENLNIDLISGVSIVENYTHIPVTYEEILNVENVYNISLSDAESSPTSFDKKKKINVTSITGTPTISRAVPIKITGGDDSTTGTGNIILDWTNISTKADIAIYDEDNNLLDYYFEFFDPTTETAIIWVYKNWVRDNSFQAQIFCGGGAADQSVTKETVFDKETDLLLGYLFNELSGNALDITSNNYDGNLYGAAQGQNGIIGNAYYFNGNGDYIESVNAENVLNGLSSVSFSFWINADSIGNDNPIFTLETASFASGTDDYTLLRFDTGGWAGNGTEVLKTGIKTNTGIANGETESYATGTDWIHLVLTWDSGSSPVIYKNGNVLSWTSPPGTLDGTLVADILTLGRGNKTGWWQGLIDNTRIYQSYLSSNEIKADYDSTKSIPSFFSQLAAEEISTNQFIETIDINNINKILQMDNIASWEDLSVLVLKLCYIDNQEYFIEIININEANRVFISDLANLAEIIQIRAPNEVLADEKIVSVDILGIRNLYDLTLMSQNDSNENIIIIDRKIIEIIDCGHKSEECNVLSDDSIKVITRFLISETLLLKNITSLNLDISLFIKELLDVFYINNVNTGSIIKALDLLIITEKLIVDIFDVLKKEFKEILKIYDVGNIEIVDIAFLIESNSGVQVHLVNIIDKLLVSEDIEIKNTVLTEIIDKLAAFESILAANESSVDIKHKKLIDELLKIKDIIIITLFDDIILAVRELLSIGQGISVELFDLIDSVESVLVGLLNEFNVYDKKIIDEELEITIDLILKIIEDLKLQENIGIELKTNVNLIDSLKAIEWLNIGLINLVNFLTLFHGDNKEILNIKLLQLVEIITGLPIFSSITGRNNIVINDSNNIITVMWFENKIEMLINTNEVEMIPGLNRVVMEINDFTIKENDTSPSIKAVLKNSEGSPVNLSGAEVYFHMTDYTAEKILIEREAVIEDPEKGVVVHHWLEGDTKNAGRFKAEWEVIYPNGKIETFPNSYYLEIRVLEELA